MSCERRHTLGYYTAARLGGQSFRDVPYIDNDMDKG
jgi:hypothetical protein